MKQFRHWLDIGLGMGLGMGLSLALSTASLAAAQLPSVVLVHGAFADGSGWSPVVALLQKKGYRVAAVQLPLTSLADDAAATRRVIDRQPADVVLVGHSWGGVVATEAGNDPRVKALVYLSALVPDSGESAQTLLQRLQSPMDGLAPDAAGLIWLDDPQAFRALMGADLPMARARVLAAVQKPLAARAFADVVTHAAWHDKPSFYLVTTRDQALAPDVQRRIAAPLNAVVQDLPSSHLSMVSHPDRVAAFIDQAARQAAR